MLVTVGNVINHARFAAVQISAAKRLRIYAVVSWIIAIGTALP